MEDRIGAPSFAALARIAYARWLCTTDHRQSRRLAGQALVTAESTVDGARFVASCALDRVAAGVPTGRAIIARAVHITLEIHTAA